MTTKTKYFIPLIDNGGGSSKTNWAFCMMAGTFNGYTVQFSRGSDSHPNRAMNRAASDFMYSDCDMFLCIDTDIVFSRQDIENLFSHDVPIVNGIYPKKEEKTAPCLQTFPEGPRPFFQHSKDCHYYHVDPKEGGECEVCGAVENDNLKRVRRCGRGFMLVKREVFEAMKEENGGPALRFHNHGRVEWDFFPSGPLTGGTPMSSFDAQTDEKGCHVREWQSEDWWFFERANLLGFPCLVDPRIALGHEGDKVFRFNEAQVGKKIQSWKDIPGWFTDEDANFYEVLAGRLPDSFTFAEVGVFRGRSFACLWEKAKALGKSGVMHAVDTFEGSPGDGPQSEQIARLGHSLLTEFRRNMDALNVPFAVHANSSVRVAPQFDAILHNTATGLDAIFIDGGHDFISVWSDIQVWKNAIRKGGIISGHDINEPDVKRAVSEAFPNYQTIGNCWFVVKG